VSQITDPFGRGVVLKMAKTRDLAIFFATTQKLPLKNDGIVPRPSLLKLSGITKIDRKRI
jgi:hypothetical protein